LNGSIEYEKESHFSHFRYRVSEIYMSASRWLVAIRVALEEEVATESEIFVL